MFALKLRSYGVPVDDVEALNPAPIATALGLVDAEAKLTGVGRAAVALPLRSPRTAAFLASLHASSDPATTAAACCMVALAELDPAARLFAIPNRKRRHDDPGEQWRRPDDLEATTALVGAAYEAREDLAGWCTLYHVEFASMEAVLHQAQLLWEALTPDAMPTPVLKDVPAVHRTVERVLPVLERPSLSQRGGGATYLLGTTIYSVDRHRSLSTLTRVHRVADAPPRVAALQLFHCRGRPPLMTGVIALPACTAHATPRAPVVSSDDEW
jgi:hypothetical protein